MFMRHKASSGWVTGGVRVFFSRVKPVAALPERVHERRRSVRHATVMEIAKIRLACGREELCLLRDVSPEGLKAETYVALTPGARVEIELRTGHRLNGMIAWTDQAMIGVAFDDSVPMSALLAHCSFDERLGKLRPPRLVVNLKGLLRIDFAEKVVRIGNLSQAGMQIDAPEGLPSGAPCAIALPGLPPRAATIRWCREGQAGLMLADPFDYAEFAEWRSTIGRAG